MRFKDIELRSSKEPTKWDLVQWGGSTCWVIATFEINTREEYCDMKTVGLRYFNAPSYTAKFAELSVKFLMGLAELMEPET